MALVKCSKCGGTVSTKAPVCPHCGTQPLEQISEMEHIEKLADECGSMSAAIAFEEQCHRDSLKPNTRDLKHTCTEKDSPSISVSHKRSPEDLNKLILLSILCLAVVAGFALRFYSMYWRPKIEAHGSNDTGKTIVDPANFQGFKER